MNRSWGLAVFCLAIALIPKSLLAQHTAVTELITAMVTAGFEFNEVDKLRMARLLEQKGIINCQVKEWGKALDPAITSAGRLEFLEERVKEFETKVNLVARRLTGVLGKESQQTTTLARNIARDNDLDTILERVMPSVQEMVNKVKGELKDDLEVTRIIAGEYRLKFESLCQKVNGLEARISILENNAGSGERRASKPVIPDNADANTQPASPQRNYSPPAPVPVNRPMVPDRIVSDKSILCAAAIMIKKCMDYPVHEEINGRLVQRNYHGDLYSDCHGFILVLHNKTSNTPSYSSGYYPSAAPTLAPPIP